MGWRVNASFRGPQLQQRLVHDNWSRWIRSRTLGPWLQKMVSVRRNSVSGASLQNMWKSHSIPISTKIRLMKALVWPVATYGCERWTLRKNEQTRLDAFEMKGLRKILRVSWTSKKTNKWVLNKAAWSKEGTVRHRQNRPLNEQTTSQTRNRRLAGREYLSSGNDERPHPRTDGRTARKHNVTGPSTGYAKARYSLAVATLLVVVVVVVVVVTFYNHKFVNCKATLILEIKNLRNKIQYKPKWCTFIAIMK